MRLYLDDDIANPALGWVNAVRFLQQYETSRLAYTQERHQFLPDWDAERLVRKARERERL
jgi:hypothetical protein